MKIETYIYQSGEMVTVMFDELHYQHLYCVDHSTFYECSGYDLDGNEYSGTAEFCCGEFEGIEDIERITPILQSGQAFNFDNDPPII